MRNGSMHGVVADERLGGRCRHFFPPSRVHFPSGGHAWSAEPVPFSTFEPAKSKGGWVGLEALAGIGWVDVTALGSIVGHQPLQRHVTAASVAGEHACETAACTGWWPMNAWVGGADTSSRLPGCIFHLVGTHPKRQNPSRIQAQRVATWSAEPVPFSTFEPAKSKGGLVGLEALAGIGWVDVTALGSIVGRQPLQSHSKGTSQPPASPGSTRAKRQHARGGGR